VISKRQTNNGTSLKKPRMLMQMLVLMRMLVLSLMLERAAAMAVPVLDLAIRQ
jgi:hypothetical protein